MGTINHLQTLWNSFKTLVQSQAAFEEVVVLGQHLSSTNTVKGFMFIMKTSFIEATEFVKLMCSFSEE